MNQQIIDFNDRRGLRPRRGNWNR